MVRHPSNPQIVYADLWAGRQGPWENGAWNGPNSGLFKSTDGGTTWRQLTVGLPTPAQGLSRIGFCIAPSDPSRLYATVASGPTTGGIYRSDDAGESVAALALPTYGVPSVVTSGGNHGEVGAMPLRLTLGNLGGRTNLRLFVPL